MKKIICALLVVACAFAVVSCGAKVDIEQIVANSSPTKIVTIVEYVGEDSLTSVFNTEIDKANNKSIFEYNVQRYGSIEAGDTDRIVNLVGTVYYKDGAVKEATDDSWSTAVGLAPEFKLDLNQKLFAEYTVSEDGTTVTGKVSGENVSKVLGTDTFSASEIAITVMTNGTYIYSLDISYTTDTGANVVVRTSYTYNVITLDF